MHTGSKKREGALGTLHANTHPVHLNDKKVVLRRLGCALLMAFVEVRCVTLIWTKADLRDTSGCIFGDACSFGSYLRVYFQNCVTCDAPSMAVVFGTRDVTLIWTCAHFGPCVVRKVIWGSSFPFLLSPYVCYPVALLLLRGYVITQILNRKNR